MLTRTSIYVAARDFRRLKQENMTMTRNETQKTRLPRLPFILVVVLRGMICTHAEMHIMGTAIGGAFVAGHFAVAGTHTETGE